MMEKHLKGKNLISILYAQGGELDHSHRDTNNVTGRCIERERQALLAFKRGLVDESDLLSSWGSEAQKQDCCRWVGVSCGNQRGHVIQVDLHGLYSLQGKMISPKLIELHYLQNLDLDGVNFTGIPVPDFIGSLTNLRYLDLSFTYFGGKFPSQVGNLTNLQYLALEANDFTNAENLDWLPLLSSLRYLDLNFVNLSNVYDWPEAINKLPELSNLTLEGCDLSSPVLSTLSYINSSKSLASVDLSSNHLRSLPDLTQLSSLEVLYLNNNQLSGVISGIHFTKLSKLQSLDLSSNSLVLDIHADWIPPFQLDYINLGSCKMGPDFPKWLQTQKKFSFLDISNAKISDILPSWFWSLCRNVTFMNLARNQIGGTLVNLTFEFSYFPTVHLSSNQLEGPIPSFLSKTLNLDLSNNTLSGSISFLCSSAAMFLDFLDLSNNNVSGQVPDCLTYLKNLVMLDLSYNALSGNIPTTIGSVFWIETLKLRSNRFVGQFPSSLKNCTRLKVIDAGDNKLSGPIPKWLGVSLKDLVILMLSSNHFNGSLPSQLCDLTHIQILDLSINNISGSIPKCLNNLTTLAQKGNPSLNISHFVYINSNNSSISAVYEEDATFMWKGRMYSYKNTLGLVKRIDLSSNRLIGEIPSEITHLVGLVSLNLSGNQLTGQITPEIGNLQSLDAIDLSRNQIEGRIPTSLSRIDRLSVLDLSFNNLSGKIPIGTQLQGFDPSVYAGNPQLCGPPLKKTCADQNVQTDLSNQEDDEDELITLGFYISMGLGFAAGFWGVCGTLIFKRSWRYAYFEFVNGLNDWLYVQVALIKRQLKDMLSR
ncbi:unnamed protein product [Prunus armeniaca]